MLHGEMSVSLRADLIKEFSFPAVFRSVFCLEMENETNDSLTLLLTYT